MALIRALRTLAARWQAWPLHRRTLVALVAGSACGLLVGPPAAVLALPGRMVLRLLGAIAPPLILAMVVRALMNSRLPAATGWRLARLLLLNTLVAIGIGLAVTGLLQPGHWGPAPAAGPLLAPLPHALTQVLDNVPRSLLGPLGDDGAILAVICLAVALGVALRAERTLQPRTVGDWVDLGCRVLTRWLGWCLELIPLALFGLIAALCAQGGLARFVALGGFVVTVCVALLLQVLWYMARLRTGSRVRPLQLLQGCREALVVAFTTASSTAAMPVNYRCLHERVGVREDAAALGALVGTHFNNDGTALYEAVAALFVAQLLGLDLSLAQQSAVALTSILASVGAAGIPEAGLVTMTLVFRAVGLPADYIAILLGVDWLLDRCRTTVNVLGDMNVACLLDGKEPDRP